ncbi:hypothetical protein BN1058_00992 [Paraliobacillus sp. PM-2]|uniref:LysM peptidoglycan-binding domain-containing protein n=1 Tax=Paraliobacillus sp. PM-2 TaxID=1462524 RepID=UPI00061C956D|nr:LysM peptidoglycan-binding domain-containing protein [Paraliobacillus sp. PM-2]CQR46719.1 hypothetical protein BN1058_00992 [Paraliobacillus sp. PM-2]
MNEQKDQAANLREHMQHENAEDPNDLAQENINVLELPPRKEIHQDKNKKTKWKINLIFLRFLLLLFLLVIILVVTYQYWGKDFLDKTVQDHQKNPAGETVQVVSPTKKLSEEVTVNLSIGEDTTEKIELTGRYYLVSKGDTLQTVAMDYYNTLEVLDVLRRVNQLKSDPIEPGEKLFLPTIDEYES